MALKVQPFNPHQTSVADSGNHLLARLPESVAALWRVQLQGVELSQGDVLSESGVAPSHVYFPSSAIVSLVYTTAEGQCSEVAVVGLDGLVGISVVMGGDATPHQAVVQSAGHAWRLPARFLRDACRESPEVLCVMLAYAHSMITQVAQTAACNRHHSIDQLLCRRLLMGLDRSTSPSLVMTQESAANLLGVRREGVTGAASKLRQAGAIEYSRGRIAVLDRAHLEARMRGAACVEPAAAKLAARTATQHTELASMLARTQAKRAPNLHRAHAPWAERVAQAA
jgi:CRP-like cAMP-binding protein